MEFTLKKGLKKPTSVPVFRVVTSKVQKEFEPSSEAKFIFKWLQDNLNEYIFNELIQLFKAKKLKTPVSPWEIPNDSVPMYKLKTLDKTYESMIDFLEQKKERG